MHQVGKSGKFGNRWAASAVAVTGYKKTRKTTVGNRVMNIYTKFHDDRTNNECVMMGELKVVPGRRRRSPFYIHFGCFFRGHKNRTNSNFETKNKIRNQICLNFGD